jgi:hypothetical protein
MLQAWPGKLVHFSNGGDAKKRLIFYFKMQQEFGKSTLKLEEGIFFFKQTYADL